MPLSFAHRDSVVRAIPFFESSFARHVRTFILEFQPSGTLIVLAHDYPSPPRVGSSRLGLKIRRLAVSVLLAAVSLCQTCPQDWQMQ
jgi:hypothetical protein